MPDSLYFPALRHGLSLSLALCCGAVLAAPVPAKEQRDDVGMLQALRQQVEPAFLLHKELQVDPALRTAANALSEAHLVQVERLLKSWVAEERARQDAQGKSISTQELFMLVLARLFNELSLWQLDPGDAAYEEATLAVLKSSPQPCAAIGGWQNNDFGRRIARIQAMPALQRDAALATERQLLARWGQVRAAVPPMPEVLAEDAITALLKRWHDGGPRPALALSPALASKVLAERHSYASLHKNEMCALQQWWLQMSLLQGTTPAAALHVFRYATMNSASERYGVTAVIADDKGDAAAATSSYPKIARNFSTTGSTRVRVRLNAAGQPLQASIVERTVRVPGIGKARPVAFEQIFDAQALHNAMKGKNYKADDGGDTVTYLINWHLDGMDDAREGAKP